MSPGVVGMKRILGLAVIGIASVVLAGCGGGGSSTDGSGGGEASAAPSPGGTLTVAQGEEVSTLDPVETVYAAEVNIVSQIVEPLWRENTEGKLVPWLLQKVRTSSDGRVWTLTLKPGIKFSTGDPLTSEDVVFTLERARKSKNWEELLEGITKVEALSPSTVRITNAEPAAELPSLLSQWSFGIEPTNLGGASEKDFASKPIGTGPFKMASWKRGETLTLEKNPYYWMPQRPYLDRLEFKTVLNPNSRVSQLQGGQLDLIYQPPWSQFEALQSSSETEAEAYALGYIKMLQFNVRKPPFDNKKVRTSISLAIDREGMVNAVLHGHGEPAGAFIEPPIEFHNPNIKAKEQDIPKAKELLAEAEKEGVDPSFTLVLPNEDNFWVDAVQIVQQNLEEIGFTVKIQKLDTSTWYENVTTGKTEASTWFNYSAVPTPTESFAYYNIEAQRTGGSDAETTRLLKKAMTEVDRAKRQQIYFRMQEIVDEDEYVIPVAYEPFLWASRSDVTGMYVGGIGIPWFSEVGLSE